MPDSSGPERPVSDERRRHPRVSVRLWAVEKTSPGAYYHLLIDLSLSGLRIQKRLPFPVGSRVRMEIPLPDGEAPLPVSGRIVANYLEPASSLISTGIEFIELDEPLRDRLRRFLSRS